MNCEIAKESTGGKSTGIRANQRTIEALRKAATELAAATGQSLLSDDARMMALVRHWENTKRDSYGIRSN